MTLRGSRAGRTCNTGAGRGIAVELGERNGSPHWTISAIGWAWAFSPRNAMKVASNNFRPWLIRAVWTNRCHRHDEVHNISSLSGSEA
jgi:hypothetical protein